RALRWLLAQPGLSLYDNQLRWQAPGQPVQALHDVRLQQFNGRGDYRLQAEFRLGDSPAQQHALVVVNGDPLAWRDTPWQAYLQVQDLPAWQPWLSLLPQSWQAHLNQGDARLWLSSAGGAPSAATLALADVGLDLQVPGRGRYAGQGLRGVISLSHDQGVWHAGGEDLSGTINDQPLPLQRLAVDYGADSLVLAAARVSLADAHAMVAREKLLPESVSRLLAVMQPSGWLPRVQLRAEREEEGWRLRSVNSEFKALTLKATDSLPGVRDLAGWAQGGPEGGLLYLDTRRGELNLHTVFREPVPVDVLRGGVRWLHADGVWHVDSDVLQVSNADASGHAQLAVRIPDGHPEDARLDLLAGLERGQVSRAWRYVPWHSAGDHTLAWLQRALVAGTVDRGSFLFSGNLHHDQHHAGHFEMQLQVKGATLDYVPGWPAVQGLDGLVRIAGRELEVVGERASIMAGTASRLHALIPDLHHGVLAVDADLDMDIGDLDRLLAESPLKAHAGGVAELLALKGPAQAHLGLSIPLHHGDGPVLVKVNADLKDAEVGLPAQRLLLSRVSGPVSFDSRKGLDGALQGMLWGRPAEVRLSGVARARRWQDQRVDVDAQVEGAALGQWLGTDLSPYLRGQTPVRVALDIPVGEAGQTDLRVSSPLTGLRLLLPEPFTKGADERLPLNYQGKLGSTGEHLARASVGDMLQAGLVWRGGRLHRLLLRAGLTGVAWPDQPGLFVEARLPELNVADWRRVLPDAGRESSRASALSGLPAFRQLTLQADRVAAGEQMLGPTRARIQRDGDDWQIRLSGAQPRRLPEWPVTDITTTLSREQGLWRLDPLEIRQPQAAFVGSLSWMAGPRALTTLKGSLDGKDVRRLLEQLGQGAFVTGDSIAVKTMLQWPGAPQDFAPGQLQGSLDARLKNGRLVEAGGINLVTRVFGLLNASNIMRRLRFDFTDVTRKGLNFDQLMIQGDLNAGIARPASFDLEGPTVSIRGKGSVNLNTGEVDQQLRVGVPVSSAVPVVAGFLAGPVVGGALVAADLLLDKPLSRLTSVRYHVTGSWDALKINDEVLESLPDKARVDGADKPASGKDD
ncbi:MAG: AsmA-like C-terminal region-containing protein, partial [Perlucidibaca sp.]